MDDLEIWGSLVFIPLKIVLQNSKTPLAKTGRSQKLPLAGTGNQLLSCSSDQQLLVPRVRLVSVASSLPFGSDQLVPVPRVMLVPVPPGFSWLLLPLAL